MHTYNNMMRLNRLFAPYRSREFYNSGSNDSNPAIALLGRVQAGALSRNSVNASLLNDLDRFSQGSSNLLLTGSSGPEPLTVLCLSWSGNSALVRRSLI